MSATAEAQNGYVRLPTLIAVSAPVIGALGVVLYVFVTLSIQPLQRDIDQNARAIYDIRQDLVPRKEHDRDWSSETERFADLQRQIDQNRLDLHDIYNTHDALADISQRLRALETHSGKEGP